MSFQAMSWAVDVDTGNAGQKLVLIMLANYCNAHTGQCNPSHERLAKECCMGMSTLRMHLASLESSGHISIERRSTAGFKMPNQYVLHMQAQDSQNLAQDSQNLANRSPESGYKPVTTNHKKEKDKKADASDDAISTPRSKKMTLKAWIEVERAAGRTLISKTDSIFEDGLPADYVILAWKTFADTVKPSKLQIDWRQTFRNYVRGDYLKLWAVTRDGQFFLTTAGKQNAIRFGMQDLIA